MLYTHSNETAGKREAVSEVRLVDVSLGHMPVRKLMNGQSVLKHKPCEVHNGQRADLRSLCFVPDYKLSFDRG